MPKSPVPLAEIRDYLTLEDTEGLVPGSVRYVGAVATNGAVNHYWSYPLNGALQWVCLSDGGLADAAHVPDSIRARTAALELHRVQRPPAPPRNTWVGTNLSAQDLPRWVPTSQVKTRHSAFEAIFPYDFDRAAAVFGATPSTDKAYGGRGPCRIIFLELARNRLAMLECDQRFPDRINLYLPEDMREMLAGIVYWDDYDQVMNPLGVSLEQAFRQGGMVWKHRKPTHEAEQRTRDHYKRIWLPRD